MHELTTTSHSSKSHRITLSSITNATTKQPTRSNRRGTQQQQQERTGRQSIASVTADQQKGTQQRIAARAATAMAQFRKRQPRNFLSWGDNRKATIKRYPDGTQEILVPQTLTHEQEHYEFPPRSRLLKKLANSTAERQRLSSSQHNIIPLPQYPSHSTVSIAAVEPDQTALTEWFSGRRRQYRLQQQKQQEQQEQEHHQKQSSAKEKAVMDWMTDIEQSTSLLKSPNAPHNKTGPTLNALDLKGGLQDTGIHFRSNAGKLLASGSSCQKLFDDLSPPDENAKTHYVRRWRLNNCGNRLRPTHSHSQQHQHRHLDRRMPLDSMAAGPIPPATTHLHHHRHPVPRPTMSSSPTPKSGMVQLVQMFHKTLQEQQARAHERMQQLETLLEEERCKRQDIQRTQQLAMSRLDSFMVKYEGHRTPPSPTLSAASSPSLPSSSKQSQQNRYGEQSADWTEWMGRINRLEATMETQTRSRDYLQQSINHTAQEMDVLKQSVSAQAYEHTMARLHLETKIDEAFTNLARLTRQRNL
ncbi:hypothetical protein [Absidia glauca]|uniref:Uncharacterized protein n=1 Tax=Absidia glauca TaxID=4829 RepID=A0A163J070_ABSGL|nr:hypothetical protein [Absidia glauca]